MGGRRGSWEDSSCEIQVHGEVLFLSSTSTFTQKALAWEAMTEKVNAISVTTRTVHDLKKRWQDIKVCFSTLLAFSPLESTSGSLAKEILEKEIMAPSADFTDKE